MLKVLLTFKFFIVLVSSISYMFCQGGKVNRNRNYTEGIGIVYQRFPVEVCAVLNNENAFHLRELKAKSRKEAFAGGLIKHLINDDYLNLFRKKSIKSVLSVVYF